MPSKKLRVGDDCFEVENDGWVSVRIAGSETDSSEIGAALSREASDNLPYNFRYALQDDQVFIQGDLRGDLALTAAESKRRLQAIASDRLDIGDQILDEDEIAFALAQFELEWERDEEQWQTTFTWSGGTRCELVAEATTGGVRVSTILAKWEGTLDSVCKVALVKFLGHANARLRFVRLLIGEQQALADSTAMADRLESELPDSVFAVAAAFQAIAREVDALLLPEMASQYIEINSEYPRY